MRPLISASIRSTVSTTTTDLSTLPGSVQNGKLDNMTIGTDSIQTPADNPICACSVSGPHQSKPPIFVFGEPSHSEVVTLSNFNQLQSHRRKQVKPQKALELSESTWNKPLYRLISKESGYYYQYVLGTLKFWVMKLFP